MSKSAVISVVCVGVLTACGGGHAGEDAADADIARVKEVRSSFGPEFSVTETGPTGVDPKLLGPQTLPPGLKFDPADCFGATQVVPPGVQGNMAAVTAEGEGNRFIAIAVETSEEVPLNRPASNCQKVGFAGGQVRGLIQVVEAPQIDGVETLGVHRVVQTAVDGRPRTGQVYTYLANFGPFLVVVTANPLVVPGQPVAPVNTERAGELLTEAVAAVKG
ncbi:DUF5642 family protein [Mycolicibacterium sp. XJ1819]